MSDDTPSAEEFAEAVSEGARRAGRRVAQDREDSLMWSLSDENTVRLEDGTTVSIDWDRTQGEMSFGDPRDGFAVTGGNILTGGDAPPANIDDIIRRMREFRGTDGNPYRGPYWPTSSKALPTRESAARLARHFKRQRDDARARVEALERDLELMRQRMITLRMRDDYPEETR